MKKKLLLLWIVLFVLPFYIIAQNLADNTPKYLVASILKSKPDTNRVDLELKLGTYYLLKPGDDKIDLDRALKFFNQALSLSQRLHSAKWELAVLARKGDCYLQIGDLPNGKASFMQIIRYYQKRGDKRKEATVWSRMGECMIKRRFSDEKVLSYSHARSLYQQTHDKLLETDEFLNIAEVHVYQGKTNLAENELLKIIEQYRSIHYLKLQRVYELLASVNRLKGDLRKDIFYKIETIKSMEATADTSEAPYYYYKAAETYYDLKEYNKGVNYIKKTLKAVKRKQDYVNYYLIMVEYLRGLIGEGKEEEALQFLKNTVKEIPPSSLVQEERMNSAFGNCYQALHEYGKAEKYYLAAIDIANQVFEDKSGPQCFMDYKQIGDFYVNTKQYKKADFYLKKIVAMPEGFVTPLMISRIQLLQFKIDSASGNLKSAINHYQLYKKLTDSIYNATKSKQIEELQIQYETSKKDKDILLLKRQSQLQQNQVSRTKAIRNVVTGGSVMLLLLLGVGYNRYRLKQRSNLLLQEKQKEISTKNVYLERLLRDNEWLLREVHHRVKNNLQIVMSLLNSQSAYLQDEAALNAVQESQHRVQAMSLIHQKLYKSNNVSNIFMPDYIDDLVEYLKDSFKTGQNIYFELLIDPISLDVLHAVPVGLILNEVITNAIKYAFPPGPDDRIMITLQQNEENQLALTVRDNGKGFSQELDLSKRTSFGLTLVSGLTQELGGEIKIENQNGTILSFTFKTELVNHLPIKDIN